jgi:hypothetical protein
MSPELRVWHIWHNRSLIDQAYGLCAQHARQRWYIRHPLQRGTNIRATLCNI